MFFDRAFSSFVFIIPSSNVQSESGLMTLTGENFTSFFFYIKELKNTDFLAATNLFALDITVKILSTPYVIYYYVYTSTKSTIFLRFLGLYFIIMKNYPSFFLY